MSPDPSLRGRLAVRVSGQWNVGRDLVIRPFWLLGVWQEFDGRHDLSITSGSESLTLKDDPLHTFAQASVGLDVSGGGGLTGYLRVDSLYSDKLSGGAIRLGGRYTFGQ